MIGKSIRIYLDNGDISGIKHAEIVNWTGQAISSPRIDIKQLSDWEEAQKPGIYFLFGNDDPENLEVYIGEAENVYERIQQHVSNKDFWNEIVFFTSKDNNLTKAHVKYLESRLIQEAKIAERYTLLNGNTPQSPLLPRGDKDSMEEFIQNLKILLGVLGHKTLESINDLKASKTLNENNDEMTFFLKFKKIQAEAIVTTEGFVVRKGSQLAKENQSSLSNGYRSLKVKLLENKIIEDTGNQYVFLKDYLFSSPSQAAAIIVGSAINGRNSWKTKNGITLKEIESNSTV